MNQHPATRPTEQPLPDTLRRQIDELVDRLHDTFNRMPGLIHVNRDNSVFAPRVGLVNVINGRFALMAIDVARLWHVPLDRLRRPDVIERLSLVAHRPVRLIPPDVLAQLFDLDPDLSQSGVVYGIDLLPRPKRDLPRQINLPDNLSPDHLALGETIDGPLLATRNELRGLIIAGAPGSGKSTLLQALAYQGLRAGWQIYLADPPDGNTFVPEVWNRLPGIAAGVGQSPADLLATISRIHQECNRRSTLFKQIAQGGLPPEDLEAYNRLASEPLPPLLLIIDEFNAFADEVLDALTDLARRARKWGLLVILAGQSWYARDIPRSLSSLFQTRIVLRVNARETARTVLESAADAAAAVRLTIPGRALIALNGIIQPLQCYRVPADRIMALLPASDLNVGVSVQDAVVLSDLERRVAVFVVEHGEFNIRAVWDEFKPEVSYGHTQKIAARWEQRGWLQPQMKVTESRRVTPALREVTGPGTEHA